MRSGERERERERGGGGRERKGERDAAGKKWSLSDTLTNSGTSGWASGLRCLESSLAESRHCNK